MLKTLKLKDNTPLSAVPTEIVNDKNALALLEKFQGKSLDEWAKLGVKILSWPSNSSKDESSKKAVYTYRKNDNNAHLISTNNHMGVLRLKDSNSALNIEICSRFDDERHFFLNYMLCRAFGGTFISESDLNEHNLWDILIVFLFLNGLESAFEKGIFRQYISKEHNDMKFKGRLNLTEHLRRNIPFRGSIAYSTHEMSFDNPMNRLIRHCFAFIEQKYPGLVSSSTEPIKDAKLAIEQNTPSWLPNQIQKCIMENLRPLRHSYLTEYESLRKICLMLLQEEGAGLYDGNDENEASGILFDGAWLWENYLWTILKKLDFKHPDNVNKKKGLKVFNSNYNATLFPDFYRQKKNDSESTVVLDAKYQNIKSLTDNDGESYIVKQILSYMFLLDARRGGIIVPKQETHHPNDQIEINVAGSGRRATWSTLQLNIPKKQVISAGEFLTAIKKSEVDLIDKIKSLFS